MGIKLVATSSYLPPNVMKNQDWQAYVETSDEWIIQRTGIKQRHFAKDMPTSDLCIKAAKKLIADYSINPIEIGCVIVATITPDSSTPSVANLVQAAIGAINGYSFDINAACSGFVFALHTGECLLKQSRFRYALVIGAETLLSLVDWTDRTTAILFGDGAGAVLLERTECEHTLIKASDLHADGNRGKALTAGTRVGMTLCPIQMDGKQVFELVVKEVPMSIQKVCVIGDCTYDQVDYFVLHQANARLIQQVAKKLKQPMEKFPTNIETIGNTSAASIPILLDQLVRENKLKLGSKSTVVLSGFGGGLTWGSLLLEI